MVNVLHLINYLGNGGTEVYIYSLAKELHNINCKFYIAYSEDGPGREMFESIGVELIHLEMKYPFDLSSARNLKSISKNYSIDIIHTHFLRENYISVISKWIGNHPKLINTRHMLNKNSFMVNLLNRVFTKFNEKIIAVSLRVRDVLLHEGIPDSKIRVVYNGIDFSEFGEGLGSTFRDEIGCTKESTLITTVARFSDEKGHRFLLESIKYYFDQFYNKNNKRIDIRFILVGDGILFDEIKETAARLGIDEHIVFTGFRRDIGNILMSSDIYISHSKSEAFGISILEAIAAHVPVITTDSGGTKEIINNDLDNGILIEYNDKIALAESIDILANNVQLRNKFSSNAIEIAEQKFNIEKLAKETLDTYLN